MRLLRSPVVLGAAVLCLAAVSEAPPQALSAPLRFTRETIEITLDRGGCEITGVYHFRNPAAAPVATRLYYPFVVNPGFPYPDSIAVTNLITGEEVAYTRGERGVFFRIHVPPEDSAAYGVRYWQRAPLHEARYILTTTAHWKRPLEEAEYVVKIPGTCRLTFASLGWDQIREARGYQTCVLRRRDFTPEADLVVRWEEK
jgi:hypothetical protein